MTDPADSEKQLKELQEKIKILSLENEILAERAEDAALLGLIAEKISSREDPKTVIDTGLEQISLLKDIPLCAYCSIVEGAIRIESSFVSFSDAALEGISLILPATLAESRSILLTGDVLHAANLALGLPGQRYEPTSLLLIHFENSYFPVGFFVFADSGRLAHCEALLLRVTELLSARIGTIRLINELQEAKEDLDRKVAERTNDLSYAYEELEQEMAERVTAQESLQAAEKRYRDLTENSRDMIYRMSLPDGVYEYVSPASVAIFGYSPDEFYGTPVLIRDAIHPVWRDFFATQWENLLRGVMPDTYEYQIIHKSGGVRWLNQRNVLIRDEKGRPIAIEGIVTDITERKLAENEVLRSKQVAESIINSLPGIFYILDDKGRLEQVNDRFAKVSGYSVAEVLSMHALEFFSVDEREQVGYRIREVFEKGESSVEADFVSRDGNRMPYYFTGFRAVIDDTPLLVGVGIDISDRKSMEKALRESENKYRSLFEESQDMVFISTYDGRFVDINPAGISRLGYGSKEELLQVPIRDTYAEPADRLQFLDLLKNDGFVTDFETVLLRRDGEKLHVSINATPIRDDLGNITSIRGIIRDITEHRKLEDQLRQSQKMESIGTLAGGVAHDFNNILTAIIGYGHLTLRKMEKDDPNRLNVEQMLEASDRAAHLTKDLLLFSRKQPIHRKLTDLKDIIRKLEKFLIRVIGEDIAFMIRLPQEEMPVLADAHQIEQVLMNLATNARDAMPRGGALTVVIEQTRLDEQFVRTFGYGKPGLYTVLTISDTGEGMDEQTRQKIFEPFYTTKEVGKGTGLGLAVVYGIVRQHEGYISVESEQGKGTTFRIYLPLVASYAAEDEGSAVEDQPVGGTETILLAEDNEAVRDLTLSVLTEFGYTVITAVDGEDAVNKYNQHSDRIQLLLFDLIMPRKSGKEAYELIRKIRPEVKILFASGYSPDIVKDRASLGDDKAIIFKPVSPAELLKQVREVLDKGNG